MAQPVAMAQMAREGRVDPEAQEDQGDRRDRPDQSGRLALADC